MPSRQAPVGNPAEMQRRQHSLSSQAGSTYWQMHPPLEEQTQE
jgi:hypothetical protein